jgi:hypothetical protein
VPPEVGTGFHTKFFWNVVFTPESGSDGNELKFPTHGAGRNSECPRNMLTRSNSS